MRVSETQGPQLKPESWGAGADVGKGHPIQMRPLQTCSFALGGGFSRKETTVTDSVVFIKRPVCARPCSEHLTREQGIRKAKPTLPGWYWVDDHVNRSLLSAILTGGVKGDHGGQHYQWLHFSPVRLLFRPWQGSVLNLLPTKSHLQTP